MNLGESIAVLKVQVIHLQRWVYVLAAGIAAHVGVEVLPVVSAYLGQIYKGVCHLINMVETNESTDKTNDTGEKTDKPLSLVEEARSIRDEIISAKEGLKVESDRAEKIKAEAMLSSSAGGHIEAKKVDPADEKVEAAAEYFKDTQLEKDIRAANKKNE